jgi:hypothetical protein
MNRQFYYIGIAFFGMINGMFSPFRVFSYLFSKIFMVVPLLLATATVIIGGIPAALYERFSGATEDSTEASLWIWLAGTAFLTIPAIGNFLKVGL